jgi:hypothetical protein
MGTLVPFARCEEEKGGYPWTQPDARTATNEMRAVATSDGRTGFKCLHCDEVDPLQTDAVKWADSPLASPTKAA